MKFGEVELTQKKLNTLDIYRNFQPIRLEIMKVRMKYLDGVDLKAYRTRYERPLREKATALSQLNQLPELTDEQVAQSERLVREIGELNQLAIDDSEVAMQKELIEEAESSAHTQVLTDSGNIKLILRTFCDGEVDKIDINEHGIEIYSYVAGLVRDFFSANNSKQDALSQ